MKEADMWLDSLKERKDQLWESIDLKIQEKAVLNLKAELAMRHKSFESYTDEELEIMLVSEKAKIVDSLKTKSLLAVLALFGLSLLG
jgi:hypothetical protein